MTAVRICDHLCGWASVCILTATLKFGGAGVLEGEGTLASGTSAQPVFICDIYSINRSLGKFNGSYGVDVSSRVSTYPQGRPGPRRRVGSVAPPGTR